MNSYDFHCAHAVFQHLQPTHSLDPELLTATSAFLGGTLFMGLTCSAYAAGVMAVGLKIGEIENSYWRVIRLLVTGMDVRDEYANKFHRMINTGQRLSEWFVAEYGSINCQAVTHCDFSSPADVEKYIAGDGVTNCREIAWSVAEQVQMILAETNLETQ